MTKQEAIYILTHEVLSWAIGGSDASEAIKMAISALEEQEHE